MKENQSKQLDFKSEMLEKCVVQEIIKNKKIKEGTIFQKRYNAYNCFSHLIGKTFDENSKFRVTGIVLNKFNKKLEKENILALNIIHSSSLLEEKYKNYLSEDNKLWNETVSQDVVCAGLFYTDNRYTFLFIKELNLDNGEQCQFLGLYKFIGYDEKNYIRKWEKCVFPNNEISISEDEIIKAIKEFEEE